MRLRQRPCQAAVLHEADAANLRPARRFDSFDDCRVRDDLQQSVLNIPANSACGGSSDQRTFLSTVGPLDERLPTQCATGTVTELPSGMATSR